jgi:hypothetical protein
MSAECPNRRAPESSGSERALTTYQDHPTTDPDSSRHLGTRGHGLAHEQERAFNDTLSCRQEAEDAIKARLQQAEQAFSPKPAAQEKLKGLVAAWLSAMKVIPRAAFSHDTLFSPQEDDCRMIGQRQSELEVELL